MGIEYGSEHEREEYKKRIERQKAAIGNLLEIAMRHTRLFDEGMKQGLRERKEECDRLYRKLDKGEFEIAIVGLEKAGKSTFANALIGNRILPDADERCTYTSTCIKYGPDQAKVKFFTLAEFDKSFREKLETMGFENTKQYSIATLTLPEYSRMFKSLSEREQRQFETNVNEDVRNILKNSRSLMESYLGQDEKTFEGEQLKTDDFKKYIVSPDVAIAVKEVLIESSRLKDMPNAIVYDVPGFDSPTQIHEDQTIEKMKKADVIILIASAEKPSFTAPSLNTFNKAVDDDNVELSDKLFIFGNRADAANTLGKNIETLRNEARERNLLRGEHLTTRLIIGSAKARLQELGQEEGNFCVEKLRTGECKSILEHGDGIAYTYEKLVEYNMTDRFKVLKRKVNQNNQEVKKLFEKLRNEYKEGESSLSDTKALIRSKDKLYRESKKELIKGLEQLRKEVRETYRQEPYLSKRMQGQIETLFNSDQYGITEENIDDAKGKIEGTTSSVYVEKVEDLVRKQKFEVIYSDLSEVVLKTAIEDHKLYYDKIVQLFLSALQVSPDYPNYDVIRERIDSFIGCYKKKDEDADIYQSLIERFMRDLVEILIGRPYGGQGRLNRFLDDSSIFTGLLMFYDPGDNAANYKKNFMAIAPKDQPLLYALLFHEYKDSIEVSKDIFYYISSISKGICLSTRAMQLICSIIKRDPVNALAVLKSGFTRQDVGKSEGEDLADILTRKLVAILRGMPHTSDELNLEDYDFTDVDKFKIQYQKHFVKKELRSYEDIRNEYAVDLQILKNFLVSASIPAISIEKPFIAKEVKSIEGLMKCIEADGYGNFITDNLELLRKESIDEFDRKQKEREVNQRVVSEIETVLKEMSEA